MSVYNAGPIVGTNDTRGKENQLKQNSNNLDDSQGAVYCTEEADVDTVWKAMPSSDLPTLWALPISPSPTPSLTGSPISTSSNTETPTSKPEFIT